MEKNIHGLINMRKKKKSTLEETFTLAYQKHKENDFKEAKNLYKKILELHPKHFETIFLLGSLSLQTNNLIRAKKLLRNASVINPKHSQTHNNLGIVLKKLGERIEAINCFEKAIETNPKHPQAFNNLGTIHKELGKLIEAKNYYQKAIEIQPNYANAHDNLGEVFRQLGELQKAKSCHQKAIEINPNNAESHNNLGFIFNELEELQKAKSCYEKAIQINPNYINAYNNLGVVFDELGEHQKAIGCCEKALQIQPQNFKTHDAIINIKWENNYGNKSFIDLFNYIEEINEPPLDLVDLLLDGLIQTSQKDLLINLKNILKKKTPHNLGYKLRQATIDSTELIGNYEDALKILTEISKSPNNTIIDTERLEFKISKMHFYVGKAKEALIFLNRLSKTNDHNFLQEILSFKAHVLKYLKDDDYFNLCDYDRFLFAQELQTPNRWKNLNSFNLDLAKELEKLHVHKKHPYDQTLRNGTQTLGSLFANKNYKYKCIFELKNLFDKAIQKYIKKLNYNDEHPFLKYIPSSINISGSWSISLNNGGFHINHFHSEGWLSSVYYVSLPDTLDKKGKSKQGWLKFGEPTHNKYNLLPDKWVQPKVGLLVLFPSYFWHGTEPFQSNENRLTVAFDAK